MFEAACWNCCGLGDEAGFVELGEADRRVGLVEVGRARAGERDVFAA